MTGKVDRSLLAPILTCTAKFEEKNPWSTIAREGNCSEFIDYLTKVKNAEERGLSDKGPYKGTICQEFYKWKRCQNFENFTAKDTVELFNKAMSRKQH